MTEIQPNDESWVREMSWSRWIETAQGRFAYLLSCAANGETTLLKVSITNDNVTIEIVQRVFHADYQMTTAIQSSGEAFVFNKSRRIYLMSLSGNFELASFELPRGQAVSGKIRSVGFD